MNYAFFVAAFVAHNVEIAAKKDILGQKKDHSRLDKLSLLALTTIGWSAISQSQRSLKSTQKGLVEDMPEGRSRTGAKGSAEPVLTFCAAVPRSFVSASFVAGGAPFRRCYNRPTSSKSTRALYCLI
jgi:hypothetical protein